MPILPYFAYGANLSQEHLNSLGVNWEKTLPATIFNYRLVFNKKSYDGTKSYANIEIAPSQKVHGIIYYGLTQEDYSILDKKEGVAYGHYVRERRTVIVNNEPTLAYVYLAQSKWIDKPNFLKPSQTYLAKLWQGKAYLPVEYQEKLKNVEIKEGGKFKDYLDFTQRF